MGRKLRIFGTILGSLLIAGGGSIHSAEEFYQGKIARFVVGFPPGGGFDTYTRLIARHKLEGGLIAKLKDILTPKK